MNATSFLSELARLPGLSAMALAISLSPRPLQAADNQPPVVTITSPKTGDFLPVGAEILITATVEDHDGSVTNVEFFANGVSLGAVANPVFAVGIVWNISEAGAYALTARATDNLSASTTSSGVNVQVTSQPLVWIEAADPNAAEGNPADPGKLTVKRWGLTSAPLEVFYQVGGTAIAGLDYAPLAESVTIPAGMSTADLVVTPLSDGQVETAETVVVQLVERTGYKVVEPVKAEVTIADNQGANAAPTVTMVAPTTGAKFSAPATILLKARAEDTDGTVTGVVFYQSDTVIGPGAASTSDPKLFSREWSGVTAGSYVVSALATDNAGATKRSATVSFEVVSLPVITIAVADGTATEGTGATDPARLTVSRDGDKTGALVVHYQISGTATAGADYFPFPSEVEIPAGQADAQIIVVSMDDQLVENTESVVVELKVPTVGPGERPPYAIGVPGRAEVFIVDNDSPTGNRPPRVELVKPHSQENFQFQDVINLVAAASDIDGVVTKVEFWADGQKLGEQLSRRPASGPQDLEPELFSFAWTGAQPGRHALKALALDDDGATAESSDVPIMVIAGGRPPLVSVFVTDSHAAEGQGQGQGQGHGKRKGEGKGQGQDNKHANTATFKVQRTGNRDRPLTVYYSLSGTAKNGQDYLKLPGSVNIPAGKRDAQITVVPIDDSEREPTETVILHLEPPPAGSLTDLYDLDWRDTAGALIEDKNGSKSEKHSVPKDVFQVRLPGENGKAYRVDVSDDLVHWSTVSDTMAEDGEVHFLQPDMNGLTRRFYRVHPIPIEALDSDD